MLLRNFLIIFSLLSVGGAVADEAAKIFGPYRYRTGVEQTHGRWENTLSVKGGFVTVKTCYTMVMNYAPGKTKCFTEKPIMISKKGAVLKWRDGHEAYVLDVKTSVLTVSDGRPIAKVSPGTPAWSTTSMAE